MSVDCAPIDAFIKRVDERNMRLNMIVAAAEVSRAEAVSAVKLLSATLCKLRSHSPASARLGRGTNHNVDVIYHVLKSPSLLASWAMRELVLQSDGSETGLRCDDISDDRFIITIVTA